MEAEEYRRFSFEVWRAMAPGWERWREHFAHRDVDEYVRWSADVAGPFALVTRGLPDQERVAIREQLAEAFTPFTAGGGYELPGVCLNAVAH